MSSGRPKKAEKTEQERQLLLELDQLKKRAAELGLRVRVEPGNFMSGSCLLEEQRMIIINRRLTLEERVRTLSKELAVAQDDLND
jgi:hypothetical protein